MRPTNRSKYVEIRESFCIQLFVKYILYGFCIQIAYIMLMMYTFCRSELMYTNCIQNVCIQNVSLISTNFYIQFVGKMYTKCLYTKCIPHFDKLRFTFWLQNLAGIVLLILYTKCIQTFVQMWYTLPMYILRK